MALRPLVVSCPQCGSQDVFYSCKPDCCFNHVCNRCYTTFELETTRIGELARQIDAVPRDPDPTSPTAPCARCGECKLFMLSDGKTSPPPLVCVSCKALLTLAITNVAPG